MSNDETPKGTAQQGLDDRSVGYGKPPEQTKFKKRSIRRSLRSAEGVT
jgi:hypothetical protein